MSPSLSEIAIKLLSSGPARSEVGRKQLTLAFGGIYIASTTYSAKPLLVWEEEKGYPRYYLPKGSLHDGIRARLEGTNPVNGDGAPDLKIETLASVTSKEAEAKATIEHLTIASRSTTWVRFLEGPLQGYIRFERSEIDDWFENGALFAGIKNPYKRIDTAIVSHDIVVKVDGGTVAESKVAVLLNETGLKETYYIPATSILNWAAVEKSDLRTACPYKGEAWYLSLTAGVKKYENLIWYYQYPTHESAALQGLISFYNKENVDILVDGTKV